MADGAPACVDRHPALAVDRQATVVQPGRGAGARRQHRQIASQPCTAAQGDLASVKGGSAVCQHGHVAQAQRLRQAFLQRRGATVGQRRAAGDQCDGRPRQPVANGQRKFNGQATAGPGISQCARGLATGTADHGDAQGVGCGQLGHARPQGCKSVQRAHKQAVLARAGQGAFQRVALLHGLLAHTEPVKIQHRALGQQQRVGLRVEFHRARRQPARAALLHQGLERRHAVGQRMLAGHKACQHACINPLRLRRDQDHLHAGQRVLAHAGQQVQVRQPAAQQHQLGCHGSRTTSPT